MTKDNARTQAQAQLESIRGMVFRLEHAQDCPGDAFCDLDGATNLEGLNIHPSEQASEDDRTAYHDEDGNGRPSETYRYPIRSDGGARRPGPASNDPALHRRAGRPHHQPARQLPSCQQIEYQDWGTPWTALPTSQRGRGRPAHLREPVLLRGIAPSPGLAATRVKNAATNQATPGPKPARRRKANASTSTTAGHG